MYLYDGAVCSILHIQQRAIFHNFLYEMLFGSVRTMVTQPGMAVHSNSTQKAIITLVKTGDLNGPGLGVN
jgi:hypothetical protein